MSNLTPEMQAELDKLRDIRLPDPVGWWPPAPGWWVLLALAFSAAALTKTSPSHVKLVWEKSPIRSAYVFASADAIWSA